MVNVSQVCWFCPYSSQFCPQQADYHRLELSYEGDDTYTLKYVYTMVFYYSPGVMKSLIMCESHYFSHEAEVEA